MPTRVTPGEALGQQQAEEAFEDGDLTGLPRPCAWLQLASRGRPAVRSLLWGLVLEAVMAFRAFPSLCEEEPCNL